MAINVNGIALPDIPDDLLDIYPYVVILEGYDKNSGDSLGVYILRSAKDEFIFAPSGLVESYDTLVSASSGSKKYQNVPSEGSVEWTLIDEYTDSCPSIGIGDGYDTNEALYLYLVWSNHDIKIATFVNGDGTYGVGDEIYFANSDVPYETAYQVNTTHLISLADQARRLAGLSSKKAVTDILTPSQIVEKLEGCKFKLHGAEVSPSQEKQYIVPNEGYYGLAQVRVLPALLQEKTVTPTTSEQIIEPDSDYYGLSKVIVKAASSSGDSGTSVPSAEEVAF